MKNWVGQDIKVGDVVWRGARDGNSSSFKIGQVIGLDEFSEKVKVHWLFEPGHFWLVRKFLSKTMYEHLPEVRRIDSKGNPNINTITRVDVSLVELGLVADEWEYLTKKACELDRRDRAR